MSDRLSKWQAELHVKRKGNAYATEATRRVKSAQLPLVDESPIYQEEQREVRYQGVRENITGRKLSVSVHERFKQASVRHAKKKT